ncbi:MAG: hypothetical protein HRT47_07925 [Candidatus Caenarcaniphilales bacterium]|nr:hypothetical protein [Candidatus Caenarcaniphilales bacterium]
MDGIINNIAGVRLVNDAKYQQEKIKKEATVDRTSEEVESEAASLEKLSKHLCDMIVAFSDNVDQAKTDGLINETKHQETMSTLNQMKEVLGQGGAFPDLLKIAENIETEIKGFYEMDKPLKPLEANSIKPFSSNEYMQRILHLEKPDEALITQRIEVELDSKLPANQESNLRVNIASGKIPKSEILEPIGQIKGKKINQAINNGIGSKDIYFLLEKQIGAEKLNNILAKIKSKAKKSPVVNLLNRAKTDPSQAQNEVKAAAALIYLSDQFASQLSQETNIGYETGMDSVLTGLSKLQAKHLKFAALSFSTPEKTQSIVNDLFKTDTNGNIEGLSNKLKETYGAITMQLLSMDAALHIPTAEHDRLCDEEGYPNVIEEAALKNAPNVLLHAIENGLRLDEIPDGMKEWKNYNSEQDPTTHTRALIPNKAWSEKIPMDGFSMGVNHNGTNKIVTIKQITSTKDLVQLGIEDGTCFISSKKHNDRAESGEFIYLKLSEGDNFIGTITLKFEDIENNNENEHVSSRLIASDKDYTNSQVVKQKATVVEIKKPNDQDPIEGDLILAAQNKLLENISNGDSIIGGEACLVNPKEEITNHYLHHISQGTKKLEGSKNNEGLSHPTNLESYSGVTHNDRLNEIIGDNKNIQEIYSGKFKDSGKPYALDVYARLLFGLNSEIPVLPNLNELSESSGNTDEVTFKQITFAEKNSTPIMASNSIIKPFRAMNFETLMENSGLRDITNSLLEEAKAYS